MSARASGDYDYMMISWHRTGAPSRAIASTAPRRWTTSMPRSAWRADAIVSSVGALASVASARHRAPGGRACAAHEQSRRSSISAFRHVARAEGRRTFQIRARHERRMSRARSLVVALLLPSAQPAPAQWGQGPSPSLVPWGWASAPAVDRVTSPRWFFAPKTPQSSPAEGSTTPIQPLSHIATAPSVGLLASASPTTPHAPQPNESKKESAEAKAALERERELRRHAESVASEASHRVSTLRAEADAAKRAAADANKARHAAEAETARARDEALRVASQVNRLHEAAVRAEEARRRADHAAGLALKQAAASHAVAVDATWRASQAAASAQVRPLSAWRLSRCCLPLGHRGAAELLLRRPRGAGGGGGRARRGGQRDVIG